MTALAAAVEAELDPIRRLRAVRRLHRALKDVETETVRAARAEGASWAAVGAQLDISRQAANKRFATLEGADQAPARAERRQRSRTGWEIAIPGRRALLHIRPRGDDGR